MRKQRRKTNIPLFVKIYDRSKFCNERDKGIDIESETFSDLKFEIIKNEVIIKSKNCGVLSIDLKNCEDFGIELIEISKLYQR